MTKRTRRPAANGIEEVRREIAADGVMIAYKSLKQVCEDMAAPAQARAQAGVAIFRAGGLFNPKKNLDPTEEDLSELSGDELNAIMARLRAEERELEAKIAARPAELSVDTDEDDEEGATDLFE